MKLMILIIFLLLIPIVSADTTFFDQDDSFIMENPVITITKAVTGELKQRAGKINITEPIPIPEKNITEEIPKPKIPKQTITSPTQLDYTQIIIGYIIILILSFFAVKHYLKHTK